MADIEQMKRLAEQGWTAREIADEFKISRQRIYELAARHNISLARSRPWRHRPKGFRPPIPRVLTGGIETPVNHHVVGSISELLAAVDLMARGWKVYRPLAISRGHDLIGEKNGILKTFEVRSASRSEEGQIRFARKEACASDHYALVITGEPVQYRPELE